ncbi:glycosyltransferase family 4 protein [Desulfovibrio oxyclinae]|uniref:glycosyltransferase family 4 protein n=1 Tax=Desulfovibrio oxyclinae TaxID=63560 RepID=UPI00035CB51F|nr:glycosyltransferase family 4 protein [Desulfovibrio oxyclinae]
MSSYHDLNDVGLMGPPKSRIAPSLLVLDQWAGPDVQAGTSKNWLYEGLGRSFHTNVLNADDETAARRSRLYCLFKAMLCRPFDARREFHRRMEWAAKHPRAFEARTSRFRRAVEMYSQPQDALFQVGCLFGPVTSNGAKSFSYHDQTVSMVERHWPQWLPKNFSSYRERFFELERASMQDKDLVFTYSESARRSMIEDYGLSPEKVTVAPTACKIAFPELHQALGKRRQKLLFVSTDFHRKGGDIVFRAFEIVRRTFPELELIVLGGPAEQRLPKGARHLGLVSHGRLRAEYLSSALLLHPARYDAYPNVIKEAMACGLPAVASASAGIPEMVEHGETGLVMEEPDAVSVADAVSLLLEDEERLRVMRENCLLSRERYRPETCSATIAKAMLEKIGRTEKPEGEVA